jgi:CRP-like cAMP-binding protein
MKDTLINQASPGINKCQQCCIRELVLFADLQQDDFKLLHQPICNIVIKAGDTLYREKAVANFVYTIRSGMIKLVRYLPNGNCRIIRLLHPGDLAGIEAIHGLAYLHHAIALKNTEICRIPIADIEQLIRKSPNLYKQLTARWQKIQSDADIWLAELTVGSSKKRVANLLLYLDAQNTNESFYLPAREDLGALLAITTETVSRVIAEFKRQGLLQTQQHNAQIDKLKLKQYI